MLLFSCCAAIVSGVASPLGTATSCSTCKLAALQHIQIKEIETKTRWRDVGNAKIVFDSIQGLWQMCAGVLILDEANRGGRQVHCT